MKRLFSILVILSLMASLIAACGGDEAEPTPEPISATEGGLPADALTVANARGLTPADVRAARR